MEIERFSIDENSKTISWMAKGNKVKILCEDLHGARLFPKYKLVLALAGKEEYPSKLIGYCIDGTEKFQVDSPQGFAFSYLTEHSTANIAVVCCGEKKVDGWYDWHFSVNPSTGELTRYCPAY